MNRKDSPARVTKVSPQPQHSRINGTDTTPHLKIAAPSILDVLHGSIGVVKKERIEVGVLVDDF